VARGTRSTSSVSIVRFPLGMTPMAGYQGIKKVRECRAGMAYLAYPWCGRPHYLRVIGITRKSDSPLRACTVGLTYRLARLWGVYGGDPSWAAGRVKVAIGRR